jgi:hypothetical protein
MSAAAISASLGAAAMWALTTLGAGVAVLPMLYHRATTNTGSLHLPAPALWVSFAALAIGLAAAMAGAAATASHGESQPQGSRSLPDQQQRPTAERPTTATGPVAGSRQIRAPSDATDVSDAQHRR